jgi:superfamily I DNA/RNA helicase
VWWNLILREKTIMELNEQQQKAVKAKEGQYLVISSPGSGKTFTAVSRVANLIQLGFPENRIVCLSFTNKASNELHERICNKLNKKREEM